MAKSMKLGGGGRFQKLAGELKGKVENPAGVAAVAGMKKYGKEKMEKLAQAGKKK